MYCYSVLYLKLEVDVCVFFTILTTIEFEAIYSPTLLSEVLGWAY